MPKKNKTHRKQSAGASACPPRLNFLTPASHTLRWVHRGFMTLRSNSSCSRENCVLVHAFARIHHHYRLFFPLSDELYPSKQMHASSGQWSEESLIRFKLGRKTVIILNWRWPSSGNAFPSLAPEISQLTNLVQITSRTREASLWAKTDGATTSNRSPRSGRDAINTRN